MNGSVADAAMVAHIASAQPPRDPLKYGQTRTILRNMDFLEATPALPSFVGLITWLACNEKLKFSDPQVVRCKYSAPVWL